MDWLSLAQLGRCAFKGRSAMRSNEPANRTRFGLVSLVVDKADGLISSVVPGKVHLDECVPPPLD